MTILTQSVRGTFRVKRVSRSPLTQMNLTGRKKANRYGRRTQLKRVAPARVACPKIVTVSNCVPAYPPVSLTPVTRRLTSLAIVAPTWRRLKGALARSVLTTNNPTSSQETNQNTIVVTGLYLKKNRSLVRATMYPRVALQRKVLPTVVLARFGTGRSPKDGSLVRPTKRRKRLASKLRATLRREFLENTRSRRERRNHTFVTAISTRRIGLNRQITLRKHRKPRYYTTPKLSDTRR